MAINRNKLRVTRKRVDELCRTMMAGMGSSVAAALPRLLFTAAAV